MEDVRNLQASIVAIYPPSSFPVAVATSGRRAANLMNRFAFGGATVSPVGEAIFQRGFMMVNDRAEIVIQSLKFDDRRVAMTVAGTSEQADLVVKALEETLFGSTKIAPIVVAYDATCTAILDIDWRRLFNTKVVGLVEQRMRTAAAVHGSEPRIATAGMVLNLAYETPYDISEHSITLSRKDFSIGPAPKTPLSERRFLSQSPTRTERHLEILKELEESLTSTARERVRR